ncbi:MAG: glycosyltransferase family 39 protein, partial [Acidobacteria bacterium]|nr:glycosyltransferase family 39 protein [Acidobacteriota bacterium]
MGDARSRSLTEPDGVTRRPATRAGCEPGHVLSTGVSGSDRWISAGLLALIVVALAIRVPLLVNAKPNDDELEHLHAAWAVAQGQVPHRDFFQNHPPLLYYLMAPIAAVMGEDLRIIYVGRAVMLAGLLLILLQLYWIARDCFDAQTGLLAILLLSFVLLWLRPSYEFRPDILQTLLGLEGLRRFMKAWKQDSRLELFLSGTILGVGFWVLSKILFPFAGLSLVFVVSTVLRRSAAALRHNLAGLLLFLGAFAVPVLVGGFLLWTAGALPGFLRWGIINTFRYPVTFSAFKQLQPLVHAVFLALTL